MQMHLTVLGAHLGGAVAPAEAESLLHTQKPHAC